MNMQTFSNVSQHLADITEDTDETCPIHNLPIKQIKNIGVEIGCEQCAYEKHEKRVKKELEQDVKDSEKASTYSWLNHRSVFLDDTLRRAAFENFETEDEETKRNKEIALRIARDYFKDKKFNTVLTGKAGAGKSHLAMSILKAVNEHSEPYRTCLFVSVDELMRRIIGSFHNPGSYYTEENMISLLTSADLLVLDDLGAETGSMHSSKTATDFVTRVLYGVVNGRMNKATIITTNLSSRDLMNKYDQKLLSRLLKGTKGNTIVFKETSDKRMEFDF